MITMPSKDPDEVLDYGVDWEARLSAEEDEIATSSYAVAESSVVVDSETSDGYVTTAWLSGGVLGEVCLVTNEITTTGGRTWNETLKIRIRTR